MYYKAISISVIHLRKNWLNAHLVDFGSETDIFGQRHACRLEAGKTHLFFSEKGYY